MLYLSISMILPLFLYTSCTDAKGTEDTNDQNISVKAAIGGNASFSWDYEVPNFLLVVWYFGKMQIAQALQDRLKQDSLRINDNYKSRFYLLLEKDKFGFNLTNVTLDDKGDYKCILNLQSTSIPVELNGRLHITGGETTTPTPTPAHNVSALDIVLGVLIPGGVLLVAIVGGICIYRRHKRRSSNDGPEAEAMNVVAS